MKSIAIITARGGSKRIPGKNIKEFLGKPILQYSVEAAVKSQFFDEVMVSTDDLHIAEVAKKAGAKVPFMRSKETSDDYSTTSDVLKEVLDHYGENGEKFEYACCIYPTAPFITAEKLQTAMQKMIKENGDCVMPVVRFSFPPQRSLILKDGKLEYRWPENKFVRTQDLEPFYHDAGQFYCFRVASFYRYGQVIAGRTLPIEVPETEVQDIDEYSDWKLAEIKYKEMTEQNGGLG